MATQQQQTLTDLSLGFGVVGGAFSRSTAGDVRAGVSAGELAARHGAFGAESAGIGQGLGQLSDIAGIYTGIKAGGFTGYASASISAAQLANSLGAQIPGVPGASAALSTYNFAKNWQSGATGADAIRGAEAGANIGTMILPGFGTAIGAVMGAEIGAISSIFGPGREDVENIGWDQYAAAYQQHGAAGVAGAPPNANFQMLAGIFDSRGSAIPFYNKYGRMGEGKFTQDMTTQINAALAKGTILPNDSPQTIYSKVVEPWINSMSPGGWKNTSTVKGAPEKAAIGNLLTQMIGQYQKGQQAGWTGIQGQAAPQVQAFGAGMQTPAAKASATARTQGAATVQQSLTPAVETFGTSAQPTPNIAAALAIPGAAALIGATMADPMTGAGAGGGGGTTDTSGGGGTSPSFLSELGSFLQSPAGTAAEFGTLAGAGLYEAGKQRQETATLAGSLAKPGAPFTAAGTAELSQLTGGPQMGGPMGASIAQQTAAAKNLGNVATEYSTGNLTAAQDQQVKDFITQQRSRVNAELAATGNTDVNSTEYQTAYQQIDTNAANLRESLINQNTQLATGALSAVQGTYTTLLNQALGSAEFGFQGQEAAVQLQVQQDTQVAGQLEQLFGAIAEGYGTAMGGGKGGAGGGGSPVGNIAGQIAKGVAGGGGGGGGVASTPSGGAPATGFVQGGGPGGTDYAPGVSAPDVPTPDASAGGVPNWLANTGAGDVGSGVLTDFSGDPFGSGGG